MSQLRKDEQSALQWFMNEECDWGNGVESNMKALAGDPDKSFKITANTIAKICAEYVDYITK